MFIIGIYPLLSSVICIVTFAGTGLPINKGVIVYYYETALIVRWGCSWYDKNIKVPIKNLGWVAEIWKGEVYAPY